MSKSPRRERKSVASKAPTPELKHNPLPPPTSDSASASVEPSPAASTIASPFRPWRAGPAPDRVSNAHPPSSSDGSRSPRCIRKTYKTHWRDQRRSAGEAFSRERKHDQEQSTK
ncbi:hypothetical protein IQ06DRAFT_21612 [Phaeosphaeriaceae sp. SRC1lsM3a]|nr:hypothetical protein IQ06DRAFT_21612 [Stagonospora sp. SRC1lsM3a]